MTSGQIDLALFWNKQKRDIDTASMPKCETMCIRASYVPAESQYSQGCTWHLQKWCPSRSRCRQPHRTPAPGSGRSCSRRLQLRVTEKHTSQSECWQTQRRTTAEDIRSPGTTPFVAMALMEMAVSMVWKKKKRLMGIRWPRQIKYGWPTFCVKRKEGKKKTSWSKSA